MDMEMSSSISGEVREDVYKDWLIDIDKDLELEPEPDPLQCCIYRVPKSIRKGKEEAYTPQIVSIGPFHHGKEELRDMEKQKYRYVKRFFKRTTSKKPEEVLAFIKDHEQRIRNCYSETGEMKSDEYVTMILHDAIFIIEFLLRNFEDDESDFLLSIPAENYALMLDLILLENQLPYFLLEGLYKLNVCSTSFTDLCFEFFHPMIDRAPDQKEFKHFTDLLRAATVEKFPAQEFGHGYYDAYIPCATKLRESGVKFKPSFSERLLVIRFEEGELRIPQLSVRHESETVIRNIMALEQCFYPRATLVCAYVLLLGSLIEDKRDAQLLVDQEIIINLMGDSKALASLVNKLCVEIPLVGNHYKNVYEELKAYRENKCNQNKAKLKRVYFSDIWRGTATIAAAILLILTFIQTMSSVKLLK